MSVEPDTSLHKKQSGKLSFHLKNSDLLIFSSQLLQRKCIGPQCDGLVCPQ